MGKGHVGNVCTTFFVAIYCVKIIWIWFKTKDFAICTYIQHIYRNSADYCQKHLMKSSSNQICGLYAFVRLSVLLFY